MKNREIFGSGANVFEDSVHLNWLRMHRDSLLDFYQPGVRLPSGGFGYVDNHGKALPEMGAQLWLGARMLHVFSIADMLGRPGAADVIEHGLRFYADGAGHDHRYGGWFATVGGELPSDRKELYGQAHVVLAAASAYTAGFDRAATVLDEALEIVERHYWRENEGRCVEAFDRTFTELDTYRGQNANMHLTEALLAAYEVTGEAVLLERAVRIAWNIAGRAALDVEGAWRLPEHFSKDWNELLDFNRDDPRHPFRPYGSQPGHWLEWSKLLMQVKGQGVDEPWIAAAARSLFAGAFRDAWMPNGGFVYTVDWNGRVVVPERFFWEPPEGIGAARYLFLDTGDKDFADAYRTMWDYCNEHFIDHDGGSWFPELDSQNEPVVHTWRGKPDVYHAFQATLYAETPSHLGLAAWAKNQAAGARPQPVVSSPGHLLN